MKHMSAAAVFERNFLQEQSFTELAGHASSNNIFLGLLSGTKGARAGGKGWSGIWISKVLNSLRPEIHEERSLSPASRWNVKYLIVRWVSEWMTEWMNEWVNAFSKLELTKHQLILIILWPRVTGDYKMHPETLGSLMLDKLPDWVKQ